MTGGTNNEDFSNTIAIVGAGAAGCVLANRILELTRYNVLLLERGPLTPNQPDVTSDLTSFPAGLNRNAVWDSSTPQSGLAERKVWMHTASGVGGATILNAGVFMVGSKSNYENWPGKHFTLDNFDRAVKEVTKIHQPQVISKGLLPADTPAGKIETGIQKKFGFQGTTGKNLLWIEEDGIYYYNGSCAGNTGNAVKKRRTAADSFWPEKVRQDSRMTILTDANVTKLMTDKDKVTGLEYETTSLSILGLKLKTTTTQLTGFHEVVLSLGSIGTPRLLIASGIGPKEELEKASVPVVREIDSVGKNLWDHPIAFFPVEMVDDGEAPADFPPCSTPCDNNVTIKTYEKNKKAVYYHMGPNIAWHVPGDILVPMFKDSGISRRFQVFMLNTLRSKIYPVTNTKLGIAAVALLTPTSRGSVGWDTIDPAYLREKEDIEAFADAFGDMLEILRDSGLKIAIPDFDMNPENRDALIASLRMLAGPFWHLSGSCAAGQVVDPDSLKIKGFKNLRIVDASVIPTNVEANTQAPTMVTAYLAGELFAS